MYNHYLIDLYQCDPNKLNDIRFVKWILIRVNQYVGLKPTTTSEQQLYPNGLSVDMMSKDFHMTFQSIMDKNYANVDIFTSITDVESMKKATQYLATMFGAKDYEFNSIQRGKKILDLSINKQVRGSKVLVPTTNNKPEVVIPNNSPAVAVKKEVAK